MLLETDTAGQTKEVAAGSILYTYERVRQEPHKKLCEYRKSKVFYENNGINWYWPVIFCK